VVVLLQTLILPLASGAVDLVAAGGDPILVFGRWFLFWGVGTRLMLAGAVQVVRPAFTMRDILGQAYGGTLVVVQKLGFANLAMGTLGRDRRVHARLVGGRRDPGRDLPWTSRAAPRP
jgi:hypothetical protein